MSSVGGREDADSILYIITLEAGQTVALFVMSGAEVGNWHTNVVLVEDPSE